MTVKYDRATKAWFSSHIGQQTTVCKCEKCGLFFKPSLGHKCKAKESDGFTDDLLNMGFTKGYNKAIDDAKSVILQTLDNEILVDTIYLRLEQLKEQKK